MLTSSLIQTTHAFSTRGIEIDAVRDDLGAKKLITAQQVHSSIVLHITGEGDYVADALITDKPGVAVGVYTADCGPILFYDKNAGLVAAAHAGWRGARYGIIISTVNYMKNMGAKDIVAVVGPCIHQASYEVDISFITNFRQESDDNEKFFIPSKEEGHFMFDLPGYIRNKLVSAGVEKIDVLDEDTFAKPERFCSYRRGTLSGVKETGRQISAICL